MPRLLLRGTEIGEARGIHEANQNTAQRMRDKGYSEDEIADIVEA